MYEVRWQFRGPLEAIRGRFLTQIGKNRTLTLDI